MGATSQSVTAHDPALATVGVYRVSDSGTTLEPVLAGRTPLSDSVLLVSGRASFELVHKATVAGIPILAAVGAPSSLAREHGLTVIGFVRHDRFNIYTGVERIRLQRR